MIEWKNGDIYERHIDGGPPIYKVIVKKNRRSAVVLRIYEVPQIEHNFAVNARGEGYVGAGYLYAESASTLNEAQLVRSMTDEEYGSLLMVVAGALGIEAKADPEASAGGGRNACTAGSVRGRRAYKGRDRRAYRAALGGNRRVDRGPSGRAGRLQRTRLQAA